MSTAVPMYGFGGGGGASLNFKVIANARPTKAKENTIWVDTDKINKYYFSVTQPENMSDYDVWFPTGTSSPVEFNALKSNGIQVYLLSAKQYVNGALVDKTVMVYQNGKWDESLTKFYFYNHGDTSNSGGFGSNALSNVDYNTDHILLKGIETTRVFIHTYAPVPMMYKKMVIVGEVVSQINDVCFQGCGLAEPTKWDVVAEWSHGTVGHFTKTVDISNVDDQHRFVKISMGISPSCVGKIYEIYFTM